MSEHRTVNVYMVAAGKYHDIDYARPEWSKRRVQNLNRPDFNALPL